LRRQWPPGRARRARRPRRGDWDKGRAARLDRRRRVAADAERLDPGEKPLAVISQTTLSLDDVASTVGVLERRFGELRRPGADDICYATQNRQDAVKRLARDASLLLVIGSETSSNAQRLVEVARLAGAEAALVEDETEVDPAL